MGSIAAGVASAILAAAAATTVAAQTVRGAVVDSVSGRAITDYTVLLLDARAPGPAPTVAAALAGEDGGFALHAPAAGVFRLRVQRIGYRPTTTAPFTLALGETVERRVRAIAIPTSLAAVRVTARGPCVAQRTGGEPGDGDAATVWEEVRKAMLAVALTGEGVGLRVTLREFTRELTAEGDRAVRESSGERRGTSARPYYSPAPDSLAAFGYVQRRGDSLAFYAPDARALLSDAFAAGHCLHLTDEAPPAPGLIGLAFTPVRRGPRPDVDGVLWVDRETSNLRSLRYRYTGLSRAAARGAFGGEVTFQPVPNGAWLIRAWSVRAPVIREVARLRPGVTGAAGFGGVAGPGMARDSVLAGVYVVGGEVLAAMTREGQLLWASTLGAIAGAVTDSATGRRLARVRVALRGTAYETVSDSLGRFRIDSVPPGDYTATAAARPERTRLTDVVPPVERAVAMRVAGDHTTEVALALPLSTVAAVAEVRRAAEAAGLCADVGRARERDIAAARALPVGAWHPAGADSVATANAVRGAQVVLQAIADTLGVVDRGTVRVLRATRGSGAVVTRALASLADLRVDVEQPVTGCSVRRILVLPFRIRAER